MAAPPICCAKTRGAAATAVAAAPVASKVRRIESMVGALYIHSLYTENPSIRLEIRRADHPAPLFHVALDQRAELFRVAADRHEPDRREALLDIRAGESLRDFAIEHVDDVLGGARRREHADPLVALGFR